MIKKKKMYGFISSIVFSLCILLAYIRTCAMSLGTGMIVSLITGAIITAIFFFASGRDYKIVGNGLLIGSSASMLLVLLDSVLRTITEMKYGLSFRFSISVFKVIPLLMIIVGSFALILFLRIFERKIENDGFSSCFRLLSIMTAVFSILFYVIFFGIARLSDNNTSLNLIPFKTMTEYLSWYKNGNWIEPLIQFAGNIMFFFVLGFYAVIFFPKIKKVWIAAFPFILSSLIELSQLIFKNGNCDIDDLILNVSGFFLGWGVMICCEIVSSLVKNSDEPVLTIFKSK